MMRIGFGYDVHGFIKGRPLILGGVEIPFELGLKGHSDADVLTHAVMDALLGGAAKGDLGVFFPDSELAYHNVYSLDLLQKVVGQLQAEGFFCVNLDCTVVAEVPKLAPYREAMQVNLAEVLGITPQRVNVKFTTSEGLGFIGEKTGIAAYACCLLKEGEMTDD